MSAGVGPGRPEGTTFARLGPLVADGARRSVPFRNIPQRTLVSPRMTSTLLLLVALSAAASPAPRVRIELGLDSAGVASDRWLAMIRRRIGDARYDSIAVIRRPLSEHDRGWLELIRSRRDAWEREIPALARLFAPVPPPAEAVVVLGNRGGEDAFTHDPGTIGFDLAALQRVYGDAAGEENRARMDRLFRHEYVHLLQKAWLAAHPYPMDTPLRGAIAEIWAEGLGVYFSMSERWRGRDGRPSAAAVRAREALEPVFAARLAALACAAPEEAESLTAGLSFAPFEQKWGALPAALWLDLEMARSAGALRELVVAGPEGVWGLADRGLPDSLRGAVRKARAGGDCRGSPG